MPPKKATKPVESTENTEEITPPAEVDNSENDTENGGEVNEKHNPIDDIEIPETGDDFSQNLVDRIVASAEDILKQKEIILANSITPEAVTHYAQNDISNSELVALRTENGNVEDRIKELTAELDKLRTKSGEQIDAMNAIARKDITAKMDIPAKLRAEQAKTKAIDKMGRYSAMFRDEIDVDEEGNEKFKEFLKEINSLAYGGQGTIPKTGNGGSNNARSFAKRKRGERVREWAKANGISVNDRGRIPQNILDDYAAANPQDTEGLE